MNNTIDKSNLSKTRINQIGDCIRTCSDKSTEYREALAMLMQWREKHIHSMDSYFDRCAHLSSKFLYRGTVVAQRLKRQPTIIDKLKRFPEMELSRMQDIGGVRVILKDYEHLCKFQKELEQWPNLKNSKDYIDSPRPTGYRGRHYIFEQNGLLTEIQLRTQLQHLWATSVETVDIIKGTSLKTRRQEDGYWQDFFQLASSAFAYLERLPMLPQHQDWEIIRLRDHLHSIMSVYPIDKSLKAYAATTKVFDAHRRDKNAYYAVLTFDESSNNTVVAYYPESDYMNAIEDYEKREREEPNKDNILVSISDLAKLHDAYPNYFKDISHFSEIISLMLDL